MRRDAGALVELAGRVVGLEIPPHAQPFLIEGYASTALNNVAPPTGTPVEIVAWTVPAGQVAVLEAFSIQSGTPHAFNECLFDVAVDGKEVQSIRFIHLTNNTERPPSFFRLFSQAEKISLRIYRRAAPGGNATFSEGYHELIYGRLTGKTWALNV